MDVDEGRRTILGSDLAQTPLAGVLIAAIKQKVTGELGVRHDLGEDCIYFRAGVPNGTRVMRVFKPIGRLLLELGWIDATALERTIELMARGRRQGEALVEIGAVDAEQLDRGLRLLQIRNLVEMAKLGQGRLEFREGRPPPPWAAGVPPNALRTLREVMIADPSAPVVDRLIERLGGEQVPVRIPAHLASTFEYFDFEDDEEAAARRLLDRMPLATFWDDSTLPRARSRALAAELALTGVLVAYAATEDTSPLDARPPSPDRREAEAAREQLAALMHATPQAPVAQRHRSIEDDRERRQRLRQRAIASNATSVLAQAFARKSRTAPPAPPPANPGPPPPPADDRPLTQEERQLEALILDRSALLPSQDFFDRLGVNRRSTTPQIKAAFSRAAQIFHPDHLPKKLAHLTDKQRGLFAAIKEAYDVLSDDAKRQEYLAASGRRPQARSNERPSEKQAREAAARGDALLARGDYAGAARAFQEAHERSRHPDHLAAEIWSGIADPTRQGELAALQKRLSEVAAHPRAARACYYLGILARRANRVDEAEQHFRKAVEIDPGLAEAGSELRHIELRKHRQTPPR